VIQGGALSGASFYPCPSGVVLAQPWSVILISHRSVPNSPLLASSRVAPFLPLPLQSVASVLSYLLPCWCYHYPVVHFLSFPFERGRVRSERASAGGAIPPRDLRRLPAIRRQLKPQAGPSAASAEPAH